MSDTAFKEADALDRRIELARRLMREGSAEQILDQALKRDNYNTTLLFGYLRSFVKLAQFSDVTLAAEALATTRQTVVRHICELENLLETKLFVKKV
ncbi:MAG: LysR family transcriptional regulator, partial [Pseudomonadota bacterium]